MKKAPKPQKPLSKQPKPDFVQNAARIVRESTSDHETPLSHPPNPANHPHQQKPDKLDTFSQTRADFTSNSIQTIPVSILASSQKARAFPKLR
jgi:hypothetical protein